MTFVSNRSRTPLHRALSLGAALALSPALVPADAQVARPDSIPLAEHPRPDFQRPDWQNLNGRWDFRLDAGNEGEGAGWFREGLPSPQSIVVPFPWGSRLSGVTDSVPTVGWYQRTITVPRSWDGKRVFVVVGASDWRTSAWLDGVEVGEHQGGYTPFAFELTRHVKPGAQHRLVLRADDSKAPYKLEGKQGYGPARGIWQTVYLEARGGAPLDYVHFTPDVDAGRVRVEAQLLEPAPRALTFRLGFRGAAGDSAVPTPAPVERRIARGARQVRFDVPMPNARLWSLEDPHLYEVAASVSGEGVVADSVDGYFGMRKISVVNLPGTTIPYIALNNKPVYLQLALDQAYHPDGFYTFPSDSVLRDEILRARQIGLNGLREHIKIETPRKLYWADKLGVLIMADVPNWWGPPTPEGFREHEYAMREMIERDYNHPAIFSWIPFNETWGLLTRQGDKEVYLPATQKRVVEVVKIAKGLDATRLVEDNSVAAIAATR